MTEKTPLTIELTPDELGAVIMLAKHQGLSEEGVLRQALRLYQSTILDLTRKPETPSKLPDDFKPLVNDQKYSFWRVEVVGYVYARHLQTQEVQYTGENFKRIIVVSEPRVNISDGSGDEAMRAAKAFAESTGTKRAVYEANSARMVNVRTQRNAAPYFIYEVDKDDIDSLTPKEQTFFPPKRKDK